MRGATSQAAALPDIGTGTECERYERMAPILVVDDESSARTTLALLLRHRGHLVREADGVTTAVRELRADVFDVIVTDLRMPDGVGLDVLHAAKTHCPDANVILLTAYPAWESAKEAMRLGAFDYFEKGQEPEGLFRRIDSALEEQASRRRIGLAAPRRIPHRRRRPRASIAISPSCSRTCAARRSSWRAETSTRRERSSTA